jgi:hypothetical protein
MILSQPELRAAVATGEIKFDPVKVELTPLLDRPCQMTFFQLTSALPEHLAYGNKLGDSFSEQSHPLARRNTQTQTSA